MEYLGQRIMPYSCPNPPQVSTSNLTYTVGDQYAFDDAFVYIIHNRNPVGKRKKYSYLVPLWAPKSKLASHSLKTKQANQDRYCPER